MEGYSGVIVTAALGLITISGVVKFIIEPWWIEKNIRRQLASSFLLSCMELRCHFESIDKRLLPRNYSDEQAKQMRNSLMKIPCNDYHGSPKWFVQEGYFSMITAYRIASFSSWSRIYQSSLLRYSFMKSSRKHLSDFYKLSNEFKRTISTNTILWYYYFDAIGDKVTWSGDSINVPIDFNVFCMNYYKDEEFRGFFDQLHIFVHFLGRNEPEWQHYLEKLPILIEILKKIEEHLKTKNLLSEFRIQEINDVLVNDDLYKLFRREA